MKDENNFLAKYPNWVVVILALLVIFQAMALTWPVVSSRVVKPIVNPVPVVTKTETVEFSARLAFVPSGVSLRKGETMSADLLFTPKRPLLLDGMDVVLTFDPKVVQVTQVMTPKLFSYVTQNKDKEGRLAITFLEEKQNGLLFRDATKLMTISFQAKATGTADLAIVMAKEGAATVIVEHATSKKIDFEGGNLRIEVY